MKKYIKSSEDSFIKYAYEYSETGDEWQDKKEITKKYSSVPYNADTNSIKIKRVRSDRKGFAKYEVSYTLSNFAHEYERAVAAGKKYIIDKRYANNDIAGVTLYRICACKDFDSPLGHIKAGDLGGYVQSETNLSQTDTSWTNYPSMIYDNARVYDNAALWEDCQVCDYAEVFGDARIHGDAYICENAKVYGSAWIEDAASVYGNSEVYGESLIQDEAHIYGDSQIFDKARVRGNARIYGNAQVCDNATVSQQAEVCGNSIICDNAWVRGDAVIENQVVSGDEHIPEDLYVDGKIVRWRNTL